MIYEYDEKARERIDYRYDAAGRRTAMINGNRDVRYEYGKNGELLKVLDNIQRLQVMYRYDNMGREILRTYMNGVTQETQYDQSGRTILIVERDVRREIIRVEGYLYDAQGRRSHSVDEQGRVTKYQYDGQSRLAEVLYPYTETKKNADLQEAAEAGLHVTPSQGQGILYSLGAVELNALRTLLNKTGGNRGSMVAGNHVMWKEQYSYDGNGNRLTKTTPWGTVQYQYDRENRLTSRGDIAYSYDRDGNLLTEKGSYREAEYRYNGQHRMVYSAITDVIERTRVSTAYQYDGFGRRTVTQEAGHETMRTLYDAFTFEVVREGITYAGGTFTTQFETGRLTDLNTGTEGSRYRWIGEAQNDSRYRYIGDEAPPTRYTGISVTLYGRGEAVAINRNASTGGRGSSAYLGKDILGSVRSSTNEYGIQEDRYEYDAFGKPYEGDFSDGMNLGYTGKPYDAVTGLYNYGYRDYAPVAARFTTVDPIRDRSNWFAYVNNDPVNYLDLWGLSASDKQSSWTGRVGDDMSGSSNFVSTMISQNQPEILAAGLLGVAVPNPVVGLALGLAAVVLSNPDVRDAINDVVTSLFNSIVDVITSIVQTANDNFLNAKNKPESEIKPDDAPTGTLPINEVLNREDTHKVKDGAGLNPRDWTGISRDGDVIINDGNGKALNLGPVDAFLE
ncbi:hypothetical protein FACS1894151_09860 [Spirochaetia bacterium]|nr:hypothetical protein FACS1894151_09860 [Spirochaetia bacterium]